MNHASNITKAVEAVWNALKREYPDLPDVVLLVAPADGGGKRSGKLGHFWANRWNVSDATTPEVVLVAEHLKREAVEVFGTLLHEAVHALAFAREIKDTDKTGKRHNRRFKALAEELGLTVNEEPDSTRGYAFTSVPAETQAKYKKVIEKLDEGLVLYRNAVGTGPAKKSRNLAAAVCECGRKIRVAESTLDEADILCSLCDTAFFVQVA